jgi:hypothetical protein
MAACAAASIVGMAGTGVLRRAVSAMRVRPTSSSASAPLRRGSLFVLVERGAVVDGAGLADALCAVAHHCVGLA